MRLTFRNFDHFFVIPLTYMRNCDNMYIKRNAVINEIDRTIFVVMLR